MKKSSYLLDTHALLFWATNKKISISLKQFLDQQADQGKLLVSSFSFWEIALLIQKGKLALNSLTAWTEELLNYSSLQLIEPTTNELITSTLLPVHHKDPFDRVLVTQAKTHQAILVSKDTHIQQYQIPTFWK